MLRLLPERAYAGLFGQQSWVAYGATGEPIPAPASLPVNASLPELLDALLHAAPPRRRHSKLSVMLPSQAARCVGLPWSANLRSDEEKQAYAMAHLEQAGLDACDSHAVHAEFRHYGEHGLAYAVPRQLLEDLHAIAGHHSLELTTALPMGGIAHMAAQRAHGSDVEISLVVEDASIAALAFNRRGLQHYDAEPSIGGQRSALRRLLTRLAANAAEFKRIILCADCDGKELASIAASFAAQVSVHQLTTPQWRRYL